MASAQGSENGTQTGTGVVTSAHAAEGSEQIAEAGTPHVIYGVPTATIEFKVEASAPLQRWDKPGYPTVYFFAKGFSAFGKSAEFPTNYSPGPEYAEVRPAGRILEMGQFPAGRLFVRRDDPLFDLVEVIQ